MIWCHGLGYKTERLSLWTKTLATEAKVIPLKEGRKRCANLIHKKYWILKQMPHFYFPVKKAKFIFSFRSFACLRYFYITTVKYSCPLQSKMFSRSHSSCHNFTGKQRTYWQSIPEEVTDRKGTFPPYLSMKTIPVQCMTVVFLQKKNLYVI